MNKILLILTIMLTLSLPQSAIAGGFDNFEASSWTKQETYADKTIHKLGFGVLNVLTGWTAVPFEMDAHKDTNIFTGLFKGIWRTVTNTVGGALHAGTFPIPLDIPLPDGGVHFE